MFVFELVGVIGLRRFLFGLSSFLLIVLLATVVIVVIYLAVFKRPFLFTKSLGLVIVYDRVASRSDCGFSNKLVFLGFFVHE